MKTETLTTNILSEDFIIPDCNCDLSDLIDNCIEYYKGYFGKDRRDYKDKLNELIQEINDRREFKVYNLVK
jgi:hypothetical protein